jgi:hypothetical protein
VLVFCTKKYQATLQGGKVIFFYVWWKWVGLTATGPSCGQRVAVEGEGGLVEGRHQVAKIQTSVRQGGQCYEIWNIFAEKMEKTLTILTQNTVTYLCRKKIITLVFKKIAKIYFAVRKWVKSHHHSIGYIM